MGLFLGSFGTLRRRREAEWSLLVLPGKFRAGWASNKTTRPEAPPGGLYGARVARDASVPAQGAERGGQVKCMRGRARPGWDMGFFLGSWDGEGFGKGWVGGGWVGGGWWVGGGRATLAQMAPRAAAGNRASAASRIESGQATGALRIRGGSEGQWLRISNLGVKGRGLIAASEIRKGDRVASMTGELIAGHAPPEGKEVFHVKAGTLLVLGDASAEHVGVLANTTDAGQRPNARLVPNPRNPRVVTLRALCNIHAGQEILVSYGPGYSRDLHRREEERVARLEPAPRGGWVTCPLCGAKARSSVKLRVHATSTACSAWRAV
jgi:hypothetical protein